MNSIKKTIIACCVSATGLLALPASAGLFGNAHDDGVAAYERGDYEGAAANLLDAATHDDPQAYFYLGNMYRHGQGGLAYDTGSAYRLIKAAATEGYAPACMELADWYNQGGDGLRANPSLSILWLQKAAKQNVVEAQMRLADIYLHGQLGVLPDAELARHWLELAAAQGNAQAQAKLSSLRLNAIPSSDSNSDRVAARTVDLTANLPRN
ncbi:MAG: sel1 repeat family protein [Pseudomonadales bacterium]|nr:sel1 repeat family protein [Pseudomonadales bacterium]